MTTKTALFAALLAIASFHITPSYAKNTSSTPWMHAEHQPILCVLGDHQGTGSEFVAAAPAIFSSNTRTGAMLNEQVAKSGSSEKWGFGSAAMSWPVRGTLKLI